MVYAYITTHGISIIGNFIETENTIGITRVERERGVELLYNRYNILVGKILERNSGDGCIIL